jgi:hypothetical protein
MNLRLSPVTTITYRVAALFSHPRDFWSLNESARVAVASRRCEVKSLFRPTHSGSPDFIRRFNVLRVSPARSISMRSRVPY